MPDNVELIRRAYDAFNRRDLDAVLALCDLTVTRLRVHGHGTESRAPMEQTQWEVTGWRDGLMTHWAIYLSENAALEAATPPG